MMADEPWRGVGINNWGIKINPPYDYHTQKLIQKWIDGEKDHMAWEAQYLNYIDKLGYENFLTAMM